MLGRDCKGEGENPIPIAKGVRPVLRRGQRERAGSGNGNGGGDEGLHAGLRREAGEEMRLTFGMGGWEGRGGVGRSRGGGMEWRWGRGSRGGIFISRVRGLQMVVRILGGVCDGWGEDDRAKGC